MLEVEGDEPLPVIAAVWGDLVRGHVVAVGGAPVVPAVASHLGQARCGDEGKSAAITRLNLAVGVGLVKSSMLDVGTRSSLLWNFSVRD